jgi:transcriptional regulator with XRE-family HTH domain
VKELTMSEDKLAQAREKLAQVVALQESSQEAPLPPQVAEVGCDRDLATQIRRRRTALGLSRSALGSVTGLSGSRMWAVEQEDGVRVVQSTYAHVLARLDELEKNGLPEHLKATVRPHASAPRASRSELLARLGRVAVHINEALGAKTLKETKTAVERAHLVLGSGSTGYVDAPAGVTDDDTSVTE